MYERLQKDAPVMRRMGLEGSVLRPYIHIFRKGWTQMVEFHPFKKCRIPQKRLDIHGDPIEKVGNSPKIVEFL